MSVISPKHIKFSQNPFINWLTFINVHIVAMDFFILLCICMSNSIYSVNYIHISFLIFRFPRILIQLMLSSSLYIHTSPITMYSIHGNIYIFFKYITNPFYKTWIYKTTLNLFSYFPFNISVLDLCFHFLFMFQILSLLLYEVCIWCETWGSFLAFGFRLFVALNA